MQDRLTRWRAIRILYTTVFTRVVYPAKKSQKTWELARRLHYNYNVKNKSKSKWKKSKIIENTY